MDPFHIGALTAGYHTGRASESDYHSLTEGSRDRHTGKARME